MPWWAPPGTRELVSQAVRETQDSGSSNPYDDIPSQSAPKQVPYWEPGKLYQPGSVVQRNNYGTIEQTALTNPSFESGDTGWTKGSQFTIGAGTSYAGSYRAVFAAQAAGHLHFPSDVSGARVQTTDLQTLLNSEAFSGARMICAANADVVVAVNGDNATDLSYYSTDDGLTWSSSTTPVSGIADRYTIYWEESTSLFYCWTSGTTYYTSPDGDVWTSRTFSGAAVGTVPAFVTYNDEHYILYQSSVYKTSDGSTWSVVNGSTGLTFNCLVAAYGATFVAIEDNGSGNVNVWTSTDLNTWTENTTGTTNLRAALSNTTNQVWVCSDGSTLVVGCDHMVAGTDKHVFSTDGGTTWSGTTTSFAGKFVRYAGGLDEFVAIDDSDSDVSIWHSSDGDTWTETVITSGFGNGELYGYPSGQALVLTVDTLVNNDRAATFPGQIVSATAKVQTSAGASAQIGISFYNSGGTLIETQYGNAISGASSNWRTIEVSALAPLDTATATVVLGGTGTGEILYDFVEWDHFTQEGDCEFIYEATQAAAGFSDESEPTWPTVLGNTVVDNEVTWTARAANCVVWEAKPILLSGATEPTWPTEEGAVVADNTILWTADSGRVKDENCPNTKVVAIASSKIFCGDEDIIAFSATTNPLDWSSANDAGFIPFGLNTYGSEDCTALGIYRSNIVAWNSKAFQMWQVDEDPQNFALLDAIPVGNRFYKSASPVSNDLVWLTDEGVRNMGIAGASTNLQAGYFGKQIDPLVQAQISAIADEDDILSLYYPGQGQYWIIFGDEAYVLTMNGGKSDMSWSRYTFPHAIDDYTIKDGDLYLRSGDKVWLFDDSVTTDDTGGDNDAIEGRVWWHYLDFGALGITKSMIGFDVVASGTFDVAIGYDQSNTATATTDYELTGDTLPNGVIPLPVTAPSFQFRLTWASGAWEWYGSALYLQDWRITS